MNSEADALGLPTADCNQALNIQPQKDQAQAQKEAIPRFYPIIQGKTDVCQVYLDR